MLRTNVVSANAARPSGPGSATAGAGAGGAIGLRRVVRLLSPGDAWRLTSWDLPAWVIGSPPARAFPVGPRPERDAGQDADARQPRRLRLRFLDDGWGLPAGSTSSGSAAGSGSVASRRPRPPRRAAGGRSARACAALGHGSARPVRQAGGIPLGQRSSSSHESANSHSGWSTCESSGTGSTTRTPMKMPIRPERPRQETGAHRVERHEHERGRQQQPAELHDDLARDQRNGLIGRRLHRVDRARRLPSRSST